MILQGLLIVLVILICANIGLAAWNKVSPPCATDLNSYFDGVKQINHNNVKYLSTMQHEKNNINTAHSMGPKDNTVKNGYMVHKNVSHYVKQTPDVIVEEPVKPINKVLDPHVANMINSLFTSNDENIRETNKISRKLEAEFETRMEGIKARTGASCTGAKVFSAIARDNTEREEYGNI